MLDKTFTPFPILKTERLVLRRLASNDEREIFILRSDPVVNKYLDRQISITIDDASKFIDKVNENVGKNEALYWAITLAGDNRLVGTICLYGFSDEDHKCEIGYELLAGFQGRGIMKEAVEIVIGYAFNTIKVRKIEALLHRDNLSSIKLLQRLLFEKSDEANLGDPQLLCYYLINSNT